MDFGQQPSSSPHQLPTYWELLNEPDKANYLNMRQALSSSACKHCRNHTQEMNQEIIGTIQAFVMRNDGDDWKRGLVCGICWLNSAIAVNTRQLRILISRCKSSINSMFQHIGFSTVPTTTDYATALATYFPIIKDNFAELRQWTIRAVKPPEPEEAPQTAGPQGVPVNSQTRVLLPSLANMTMPSPQRNGGDPPRGGC
jgi:hypothetical protein